METKQHTTKADAASEALTGVARTVRADRWMVLAWKFEDGRVVLDHRTTCHFPSGEFGLALMLAAANLLEDKNKLEGANLPTPPPLKVAGFIKTNEEIAAEKLLTEKNGAERAHIGEPEPLTTTDVLQQDEKIRVSQEVFFNNAIFPKVAVTDGDGKALSKRPDALDAQDKTAEPMSPELEEPTDDPHD